MTMKNIFLKLFIIMMGGITVDGELQAVREKKPVNCLSQADEIKQKNQLKLNALKKYDLPIGQYAVSGSGPLGIRGLREIGDVDIIVSPQLRDILIAKYGMVDDGKVKKIVFPDDDIEALWEESFYTQPTDEHKPTVKDMISRAEIIEGLPFLSLSDVLYFKRKMNRSKDLEDIRLIKEWQKLQK